MGRTRVGLAILVICAMLAIGCSSTSGAPTAASAPATRLATALQRIDPAVIGNEFEFGDTKAIAALVAHDPVWKQQVGIGAYMAGMAGPPMEQALGIDLARSDSMISVGSSRQSFTLVIGGQDAGAITAATTKLGWKGSGTLKRPAQDRSDTPTDLALSANQVRPLGHDVAFGEQHADLTRIDNGGGGTGPSRYAALADCLGEVIAVRAAPVGQPTGPSTSATVSSAGMSSAGMSSGGVSEAATGVRAVRNSTRTTSVICMVPDPERIDQLTAATKTALASGSSFQNRQKWSSLLPSARVDTVAGADPLVRVTADTDSRQAAQVLLLLGTGDLPGANGPGT